MKKSLNLSFLLPVWLGWRIALLVIGIIAPFYLSTFGNMFPYAQERLISSGLPEWLWAYGNFDGVHYVTIATYGYIDQYTQAFFPLYPLLIHLLSGGQSVLIVGLLLSNIAFMGALIILYQLWRMDYEQIVVKRSILLLLSLPTAFFFGAFYTESLFLLLTVAAFLLMRKGYFSWAVLMIALATATRIVGVFLVIALIIEMVKSKQPIWKIVLYSVGGFAGLIGYMIYLQQYFGDALYFLSAQPAFGASRSSSLVLFPQVVFRYFKILMTNSWSLMPFWTALNELLSTLFPLIACLWWFKKIRLSYWVFMMGCLLLPPLTGTFSSMPRYALMSFFLLPVVVLALKKKWWLGMSAAVLEALLFALFIRGYWVS